MDERNRLWQERVEFLLEDILEELKAVYRLLALTARSNTCDDADSC